MIAPLYRRRRAVGAAAFTPASISGLALWLDSADTSTLFQDSALTTPATADNDPVGGWKDKSGNAINATQATAGSRPTLKTAVQNGMPILRFDGVDDSFLISPNFASGDFTGFFAYVYTGSLASSQKRLIECSSGGLLLICTALTSTAGKTGFWDRGAGAYRQVDQDNIFKIQTHYLKAGTGTAELLHNSTQVLTANWTATPLGIPSRIGSNATGNASLLIGDIGEVVIYQGALSSSDRLNVESYLRTKWGTP